MCGLAGYRALMLRLGCVFVLTLVACRTESSGASAPGQGDDTGTTPSTRVGEPAAAAEDQPPDCGAEGRVWDGRLAGCLYEHAGCCYDTPLAACTAAGCPGENCRILESAPAQLYCA